MSGQTKRLIYFCGSIRGGRDDAALYKRIIDQLKEYGEILTEHIGDVNIMEKEKGTHVHGNDMSLVCIENEDFQELAFTRYLQN